MTEQVCQDQLMIFEAYGRIRLVTAREEQDKMLIPGKEKVVERKRRRKPR